MSVSSPTFPPYSMVVTFLIGFGSIAILDRLRRRDPNTLLEAKVDELESKVEWLMAKMENMERGSTGNVTHKSKFNLKNESLRSTGSADQTSGEKGQNDGSIGSLTQSGRDMIVQCYGAFASLERKSSRESFETTPMAVDNPIESSASDSIENISSAPTLAQLRQLRKHSYDEQGATNSVRTQNDEMSVRENRLPR